MEAAQEQRGDRMMTRRGVVRAGAATAAGVVAIKSGTLLEQVEAQLDPDNYQIWFGGEYVIQGKPGEDLIIEHQASGERVTFDIEAGVFRTRGSPLLVGDDTYEVQRDGEDGDGIINLETGTLPTAEITVDDSGSSIGSFQRLDFGTNLSVSDGGDRATIDAAAATIEERDPT